MKHPLVTGAITLRLILWIAAVLIAPIVISKLSREKEIKGELDYFESLVLSLILFSVAFTPYLFLKVFIPVFKSHFRFASLIWLVAGSFVDAAIITLYKGIEYWKSLILWVLSLIVSYTAGFALSSFALFLLKALR
jgi:hypothetical protein